MGRSEVRVTIHCPLKTVFDRYTEADAFRWADIRVATWTHGKPWEVGSRMEIRLNDDFGVIVDQVVTHFETNRRVDFISHFGGMTMLSQVRFKSVADDQTEIHSQMEFVGKFSRVAGFAIGPAIEQGTKKFFEDLKRACEKEANEK